MTMPEADVVEAGICNALAAGDIHAAVDMLRVLAAINPSRAELVYEAMRLGIALHPGATP